jgi:hypothetical protein
LEAPSSSDNIGEQLIEAGWRQGSLLPALAHLVLFHPDHPFSRTSKAQKSFQSIAVPVADVPRYAYGAVAAEKGRQFVIISQTCDIARGDIEPFVTVALAQHIKHSENTLKEARSSVRKFLLNEQTGLVVDLRYIVQIEKPLLLSVKNPEYGPLSDEVARNFRYWLGDRYSRPPYPDGYIKAVRDPMRSRMRELVLESNELTYVRKHIREVRTVMPLDIKPYPVELVVLLDPTDDLAEENAFKTGASALFGELIKSIDAGSTKLPSIVPLLANEWSVSEYWATEPLEVDIDEGDAAVESP